MSIDRSQYSHDPATGAIMIPSARRDGSSPAVDLSRPAELVLVNPGEVDQLQLRGDRVHSALAAELGLVVRQDLKHVNEVFAQLAHEATEPLQRDLDLPPAYISRSEPEAAPSLPERGKDSALRSEKETALKMLAHLFGTEPLVHSGAVTPPTTLASLQIPLLASPPQRPACEVIWDSGALKLGWMSFHFHEVLDGGQLLVFIYDNRYEGGAKWAPPDLKSELTHVHVRSLGKTYPVYFTGLQFAWGALDFFVALVQTGAGEGAEPC